MIKVLNVLLDDKIGGPQNRVLNIGKELKKYNIEPIMLSPLGDNGFGQKARENNFRSYQIRLYIPKYVDSWSSVYANIKWLLTFPLSIYFICKIIKTEEINIVHLQGLLNLQAALAALIMRRKIVWHLIGSLYPKILVRSLMPFVRIASDEIVVIAEKLKYYYMGPLDSSNATIIYGCIDTGKFNPLNISKNEITRLKEEFKIKPKDKVIGCIANINPAKGYEYFLYSAHLIKLKFHNIKFIIIGDLSDSQKNYHLKLRNLVASLNLGNDVIFAGKQDNIPQMLSILDIFVLSSITEGTPIAILEAMAMERAVIVTDVGGVSELVIDGITGIVVPSKDQKAITSAVVRLYENPNERAEMGKRARERAIERFSLDICVAKYKYIYEKCLNL